MQIPESWILTRVAKKRKRELCRELSQFSTSTWRLRKGTVIFFPLLFNPSLDSFFIQNIKGCSSWMKRVGAPGIANELESHLRIKINCYLLASLATRGWVNSCKPISVDKYPYPSKQCDAPSTWLLRGKAKGCQLCAVLPADSWAEVSTLVLMWQEAQYLVGE